MCIYNASTAALCSSWLANSTTISIEYICAVSFLKTPIYYTWSTENPAWLKTRMIQKADVMSYTPKARHADFHLPGLLKFTLPLAMACELLQMWPPQVLTLNCTQSCQDQSWVMWLPFQRNTEIELLTRMRAGGQWCEYSGISVGGECRQLTQQPHVTCIGQPLKTRDAHRHC